MPAPAIIARRDGRPPRDDLVRAAVLVIQHDADLVRQDTLLRAAEGDTGMPTMFGHFTPFNRWTEIDSWYEGHFLERIAPGAFKKTFREMTPKVLFQHGMDFSVGDKVLGPPSVLREEDFGPYYEVPLLDTSYNRDLVPGLEAGLYGASFRFSIMREEYVEEPGDSDHNPRGLPERTIKEARVPEFGPVTFPAYEDATAGVRSLTDEFLLARATRDPQRLRAVLRYLELADARGCVCAAEDGEHEDGCPARLSATGRSRTVSDEPPSAPAEPDAAPERTSDPARREQTDPPRVVHDYLAPQEAKPSWHL